MPNHVVRDRIWESKKLAACSLEAALAYPWILLVGDDWGRFEYGPRRIWSKVFGARDDVKLAQVENWLSEYEKVGLLERYHVDGELAFWTNFVGRPPSQRRASLYPEPAPAKRVRRTRQSLGAAYEEPSLPLGDAYEEPRDGLGDSFLYQNRTDQIRSEQNGEAAATTAVAVIPPDGQPPAKAKMSVEDLTDMFVGCFNATFERNVSTPPELPDKVRARLKKYKAWHIVAVPILSAAHGLDPEFKKRASPEMFMRDGSHQKTSKDGGTWGATNHLERELMRADQAVLTPRLAGIAKHYGVLERIMGLGARIVQEQAS